MTYVWFDGVQLHVVENGRIVKSWNAYSGEPETTKSVEDQRKVDYGPIPEGCYQADPAGIVYQQDLAWYRRWFGRRGKGYRQVSWGRCWVRLESRGATIRGGFYIHGSGIPGSAGCIDLLYDDTKFCSWLFAHGKKVCVIVHYLPETKKKPGAHVPWNKCEDNPGLSCYQNTNCSKRFDEEVITRERAQELPNTFVLANVCECSKEEKKKEEKEEKGEKEEDKEEYSPGKKPHKRVRSAIRIIMRVIMWLVIIMIIAAVVGWIIPNPPEDNFRSCILRLQGGAFGDDVLPDCSDGPGGDGILKDTLINGRKMRCHNVGPRGECY